MRKALLAIAVIVAIFAWVAFRLATQAFESERKLHAYILVLDVTAKYCELHPGMWPKSWDDLATVASSQTHAAWRWPEDINEISKMIEINFALPIEDVASSKVDNFVAISQRPPNYANDLASTQEFISGIRSAMKHRRTLQD